MPPAPPDYRIFRLFRISRNSVFSGIIGGIWGSGGFPLDWNRLGDSFRRSFSPNSGIWTQFDPFSMISDVFGLPSITGFIIWGLILMILSSCGCVWGVSAAIWTLMMVSRAILDGFGRSLGSLFEALGSLGESL